MTNKQELTKPPSKARILHISDLHFGRSFNKDSWTDLVNIAKTLLPNIVIVTGDLVDSPNRWSLKRAADALTRFEEDVKCKLIVVPGNHDTRFVGLLPIKWINPWILAALTILFLTVYCLNPLAHFWPVIWLVSGVFFGGTLMLRSLFLDFERHFQRFLLPAGFYEGFGLEIFAFDSATKAVSGARGRIPKKQFVNAQAKSVSLSSQEDEGKVDQDATPPYRIAILHHHPLPIPYDDANEYLMVADNAGAFLSEASKLGIRLVLHGHKHHSHFSRVTINAGEEKEHELAVLAVGTLSRSGRMDPPEHHFYFLRLDGAGTMEVTPYVAQPGGAFLKGVPSPIEPSNLADKRLYEAAVRRRGMKCESNVLTAELTHDGDMHYRHEFHGFYVERDSVSELPKKTDVEVGTGHIDDFSAGDLEADSQERIEMVDEIKELTHRMGRVTFGRKFTSGDPGLNFYSQYVALNAFAMSVEQHKQMYSEAFHTEHLSLVLQPIPTEIFDFVVKFPHGFKISGEPKLLIEKDGERDPASEKKLKPRLKYYPHLNIATSRIPYPRLDLTYVLQWTLIDEPPPSGNSTASMIGKVDELAQKLLQVSPSSAEYPELFIFLKTIEEKTRTDFRLEGNDPLEVSLMAYEKEERVLKIVAATFDLDDEMRAFELKYGNGIAGRAYKMNKGRMFIRKSAIDKETPNYFYPADGKPCDLKDIAEKVIISLPLRHPANEALIYGVLNLSSKDVGSRLQDIKEPRVLEDVSEFRAGVNLACYDALDKRIFKRSVA